MTDEDKFKRYIGHTVGGNQPSEADGRVPRPRIPPENKPDAMTDRTDETGIVGENGPPDPDDDG